MFTGHLYVNAHSTYQKYRAKSAIDHIAVSEYTHNNYPEAKHTQVIEKLE